MMERSLYSAASAICEVVSVLVRIISRIIASLEGGSLGAILVAVEGLDGGVRLKK